jgi:hypothetical protein
MKSRVIDDVIAHSGKKVHPRIFLTNEDFERIKNTDDPVYNAAKKVHLLKLINISKLRFLNTTFRTESVF